jgi:outer membrane lipoprotein LolB
VPVAALFDWLRGVATPVPGWRPDLSQLAEGRIFATRTDPPPETSLRVAIDR